MSKKILYEEIYQKTQNCGRTQFVKLLQQNQIKIEQLQQENEELKKQVEIKNSGFMASIEEVCEYATVLIEFEKWLEEEIEKRKDANVLDPIQVGDYYIKIALKTSLDILQELKEGKK